MIFSYSRLSTYQGQYGCPWKFYLKYVRNIPEPENPAARLGKAAHSIIENMIRFRATEIEPYANVVAKTLDLDPAELIELVKTPQVFEAVRVGGIVEEHFQISLGDDFLAPEIQGFIDYHRSDQDYVLAIDWKSNRQEYDVDHQLGLYAAYLMQKYSLPVVGKLVFLRSGEERTKEFDLLDIQRSIDWAQELCSEIESKLVQVEDEEFPYRVFPPEPGSRCQYCGYAKYCLEEVQDDNIQTQAQAEKVAQEILKVEAKLKQYKDRLKNWVETHGPVRAGDKKFVITESHWWKWPNGSLKKAVQLMQKQNINPYKVLTITADGLKYVPWDEETILSLGAQKVVSRRFDSKKV